jgi:hypothetical protein
VTRFDQGAGMTIDRRQRSPTADTEAPPSPLRPRRLRLVDAGSPPESDDHLPVDDQELTILAW